MTVEAEIGSIVEVVWVDSCTIGDGWVDKDYIDDTLFDPLPVIRSVGYLLAKTEECLILNSAEGQSEYASVWKIPLPVIRNFKVVRSGESLF